MYTDWHLYFSEKFLRSSPIIDLCGDLMDLLGKITRTRAEIHDIMQDEINRVRKYGVAIDSIPWILVQRIWLMKSMDTISSIYGLHYGIDSADEFHSLLRTITNFGEIRDEVLRIKAIIDDIYNDLDLKNFELDEFDYELDRIRKDLNEVICSASTYSLKAYTTMYMTYVMVSFVAGRLRGFDNKSVLRLLRKAIHAFVDSVVKAVRRGEKLYPVFASIEYLDALLGSPYIDLFIILDILKDPFDRLLKVISREHEKRRSIDLLILEEYLRYILNREVDPDEFLDKIRAFLAFSFLDNYTLGELDSLLCVVEFIVRSRLEMISPSVYDLFHDTIVMVIRAWLKEKAMRIKRKDVILARILRVLVLLPRIFDEVKNDMVQLMAKIFAKSKNRRLVEKLFIEASTISVDIVMKAIREIRRRYRLKTEAKNQLEKIRIIVTTLNKPLIIE